MKSQKCPACGFVGWADSENCKKCGIAIMSDPNSHAFQTPEAYGARQPSYRTNSSGKLKKGLAVSALVLGILNMPTAGFLGVGAIVGIVLAVVALNRAKENPYVYGGKELAIAGLITSILSVVMIVPILIVAAIAIPNLLASRRAANEGATIHALQKIHAAETTYQATSGDGAFGTLDQLAEANLIDSELARGVRFGYKITIETTAPIPNRLGEFHAVGIPVTYGSSGRRSFYVDESGVIRAEDNLGKEATELAPPLRDGGSSSTSTQRRYRSGDDDQ
ncbi:MAG: DUF4190 domain-containing protein [bacterium]